MSSDDNHWWAHMTPTTHNIWTCAVFATSSFNFGLPAYVVSHYCYGRALYAVFYRNFFFFKVEQRCWLWSGKWHVKGHTYVGVHRVDTMFLFHLFSLRSFKNLILSGFARDWCRVPSRRLPYISICLRNFFLEINVCVYPSLCWFCSLSDILASHDSNA